MTDLLFSVEKHSGVFPSVIGSLKRKALYYFDPSFQLNLLLKYGPRKLSLRELKQHPHGMDLGPLQPGADKVICTKNGLIHLVPPELAKDVERLKGKLDPQRRLEKDQLLLISRRTLKSINSWMHNSPTLVSGRNQCFLMMHPDDAKPRELAQGQVVTVSSRIGKIQVPVEISDEMMPGVVSMTFGWGHGRPGTRLSVAAQHAGVSMNDIVDESLFDQVSGISVLDGIPVKVSAGPG
jgi:anaerobic selenocysteine-containing dehydrogenase